MAKFVKGQIVPGSGKPKTLPDDMAYITVAVSPRHRELFRSLAKGNLSLGVRTAGDLLLNIKI